MNDIPRVQNPSLNPAGERRQVCRYCQAKLNPLFYFCPRCSTPYTDLTSLMPNSEAAPLQADQAIRLKAPNVVPLFWTYFSIVFVLSLLSYFFFSSRDTAFFQILSSGSIALVTLFLAVKFRYSLKMQFRLKGLLSSYMLIGLGALALLLLLNYSYHKLILLLADLGGEEPGISSGNVEMNIYLKYILICGVAAATEEIAFRGLMQKWLGAALDLKKAFLISAALFAVLHFSVISFPYIFLLGLFFSWIRHKTGSLYPVILLHFLHNFVVLAFFGF